MSLSPETSKKFFWALRASVWSKNKGGLVPWAPPLNPPLFIISGFNSTMMIWCKYVFKWIKLVFQTMVRFHLAGKPVSCSDFLADELRLFSAGTEGSTIEIERMKKFAKVRWFSFYSVLSSIFASLVVNVFYRLCTPLVCHRSGNGQAKIKLFYSVGQLEEDCPITTVSENKSFKFFLQVDQ